MNAQEQTVTFPQIIIIPESAARSSKASTLPACTVQNASALVVPLRSSSRTKKSAHALACSGAANLDSAGKVYLANEIQC
jgi:hypothetical protein